MGKRYTEEEKRRVQELANQGYTHEAIAKQLGRSTNAIRNHRHRNQIQTKTTQTIRKFTETKQTLIKQTRELEQKIAQLENKRIKG